MTCSISNFYYNAVRLYLQIHKGVCDKNIGKYRENVSLFGKEGLREIC